MDKTFLQKQHLYWRAGFGIPPSKLRSIQNSSLQNCIDELFTSSKTFSPLSLKLEKTYSYAKNLSAAQRKERQQYARKKLRELNKNWLVQMQNTSSLLREKMTFFWHGHFACNSKRPYPQLLLNNAIRKHALGNFRELTLAVSQQAAMLDFLNNQQNRKNQPNENFARELMELFTIGIGHYSEKDVKEAARAFTGWMHNSESKFFFNRRFHDDGVKIFMGKTGSFDGKDIINILLNQKQSARHIASKVYRYFVNPSPNAKHIEQLADVLYKSDYDIKRMMQTLFSAKWFYHPQNIGVRIKSPTELLVGIHQSFEVHYTDHSMPLMFQKQLNQILFQPPNVAGWPDGRAWINNATIVRRMQLPAAILLPSSGLPHGKKLEDRYKGGAPAANWELLDQLTEGKDKKTIARFFAPNIRDSTQFPNMGKGRRAFILQVLSMPEYQLC